MRMKRLGADTSYPVPIENAAAVVHDGVLYVIGGANDQGEAQRPAGLRIPADYITKTEQWRLLAAPPVMVHYAGLAADNGFLYVVGGYSSGPRPAFEQRLQIYDIARDRWAAGAAPPVPLGSAGSTVIVDGKLHVFGVSQGAYAYCIYDIRAGEWTRGPGTSSPPVSAYWLVAVGSQLYALARDGRNDFVLDTASGSPQWRSEQLEVPRRATAVEGRGVRLFTAAAFKRWIIVVGGASDTAAASTEIWIYDTQGRTWSLGEQLAVPRAKAAVAVYSMLDAPNACLFVVGGRRGQAKGPLRSDVEVFHLLGP